MATGAYLYISPQQKSNNPSSISFLEHNVDHFPINYIVCHQENISSIEHLPSTHSLSRRWRPPCSRRSTLKLTTFPISTTPPYPFHLTSLMFSSFHLSLCHCGPSLLLSHVGSHVHVIGARRLARTVCRSCVTSRRVAAQTETQQMGQLPAPRVLPNPPFQETGVDYAGPFLMKKGHTRKPVITKMYMCIFVCLSTKAARIDIVSDLTTEAFQACLKRFVTRGGLPAVLHSDNGTNIRGARNDLQDLYHLLQQDTTQQHISNYLLSHRVEWRFSPERAPHFGGLWEATVKSAKFHLRRVVGAQKLDFEELSTVVAQIESCLNNRPWLQLNSHSDDGISTQDITDWATLQSVPGDNHNHSSTSASTMELMSSHGPALLAALGLRVLTTAAAKPEMEMPQSDLVVIKEDSPFTHHWSMARILDTYQG